MRLTNTYVYGNMQYDGTHNTQYINGIYITQYINAIHNTMGLKVIFNSNWLLINGMTNIKKTTEREIEKESIT